jgi:cytochrome P450
MLLRHISSLTKDLEKTRIPSSQHGHHHRLLDADAHRIKTAPPAGSLYKEAQSLVFAGADTVGNTRTLGKYHLLKQTDKLQKLKTELQAAWPSLQHTEPKLRDFRNLKYLNAVIKESLRLSSGVVSGLLCVVPESGATIAGGSVPPGVRTLIFCSEFGLASTNCMETIVSCGSTFVHDNADIFPEANSFVPERWLDSPELDNWLVPFSRGPHVVGN